LSVSFQFGAFQSDNFLDGAIAEVRMDNRPLPPTERQSIEQYLSEKYTNFPINTPPSMMSICTISAETGSTGTFPIEASDVDLPFQTLTYS